MEQLILSAAAALGLGPDALLFLTLLVVLSARAIGNWIPDDATGLLGLLRKMAKLIGFYVGNRVTSGVSVNDVARTFVGVNRNTNEGP